MLRSLHLRGRAAFAHFDHDETTVDVASDTVRLATHEQSDTTPAAEADVKTWLAARGGAVIVPCKPDACVRTAVLLVERKGTLSTLRGELRDGGRRGWEPIAIERPKKAPPDPRVFAPMAPPVDFLFSDPRSLSRDPFGRLWLLEHGSSRILLFAEDDLRWLDTVTFPPGAELVHLACGGPGALAAAADGRLFFQRYGGEWREVPFTTPLPTDANPVAVTAYGDRLAALYKLGVAHSEYPNARAVVAIVEQGRARPTAVPGLEDPVPFLALPNGDLLIGEVSGPVGSPMELTQFLLDEDGALATRATFGVRSFDGRALFLDECDVPSVTTANGSRTLFVSVASPHSSEGRIETFALDSERYGNAWHRVFLDACVPDGTSIAIAARTSDDITPLPLRREANPPPEGGPTKSDPVNPERYPMGSRTKDDSEGWVPLGALDRRTAWADVPLAPAPDAAFDTFEGLIKCPPGRYLWLRITLRGAKRKTPVLHAIRTTYPRPSVLDLLPAFWRADPEVARSMDQVLALFEGFFSELDLRIETLPLLFDPRACPDEALDWLAGFIALTLDRRLDEARRRTLVREGASLFRQRGTAPGLARLLTILAGARVDIVEAFRQRPKDVAVIGGPDAILGGTLSVGADPFASSAPDWEKELGDAHAKLVAARAEAKEKKQPLCPERDPPDPLDPDALITLCRRYAHRFTAVVFRTRDADLEDILQTALERNKPAHTLHQVCWQGAEYCLGVTSFVGFGAIGRSASFERAIVGDSLVSTPSVVAAPGASRTLGTLIGAAPLGRATHLS